MSHEIKAPLPGIFYRSPSPEEPPFTEVGGEIAEGDIIGLIEVMKSFYEVKATASGKVVTIKVENESLVSAGQVLMEIE